MEPKTGECFWTKKEFEQFKRALAEKDISIDSGKYIYLVYHKGKIFTLYSRKAYEKQEKRFLNSWAVQEFKSSKRKKK